ncbi:MAG: sensor domain-containing diguanylate cyclase [Candidatus Omnitrophica bacterium]|nr:sensor domain-containing diguanylate cyclase [Candidatus Omnitrophota bacterium]
MIRIIRNLIFLFVVLFLIAINFFYLKGKTFLPEFYFISINLILSSIIIIDIIFNFDIYEKLSRLTRENERLNLTISDYKLESTFSTTLVDIIETFGKEITLDEVIDRILEAIKKLFTEETVVLFLFGDRYKLNIKGKNLNIPTNLIEELVTKGRPILVNNVFSFPIYEDIAKQGFTSFIITGLFQKREVVGALGIFSDKERKFTLRDLNIIRMVSTPISLMLENADLFEKTKLLSITDSLTQIYNRRHFEKLFPEILTKCQLNNKPLSVAMCDVDFFKFYNDTNGHPAGDFVLKTIAEILKKNVKGSDVVARYGGEEFIILFPETTKENAVKICEKLRQTIKDFKFPKEENQPNGDLTISFGVATFPEDGSTTTELIRKADMALYKAKELGKDRVVAI